MDVFHSASPDRRIRTSTFAAGWFTLADRTTPGQWEEEGHPTIYERAHKRVHQILSEYYPTYISPEADRRIRERFPIKLDPRDMKPGNGRWGKA